MPEDERYSLTELADLAGVTPRTVRYYLGQGLLPAVGQSGPGSKYHEGHLARLRLIRRLQTEHLPLAEIRRRLDGLGDDEIRELAGFEEPEPPKGSALEYLRAVLQGPALAKSRRTPDLRVRVPPPLRARGQRERAGFVAVAPARSASQSAAELRFEPYPASAPAPTVPLAFVPPGSDPPAMDRSQWDRIALSPDIELHIRRPLGRTQQKRIERLITIARELLEEDRP